MLIRRHTITVEIEQTTLRIERVSVPAQPPVADSADTSSHSHDRTSAMPSRADDSDEATEPDQVAHCSLPAVTGEDAEDQAPTDNTTQDTHRS